MAFVADAIWGVLLESTCSECVLSPHVALILEEVVWGSRNEQLSDPIPLL